VHLYAVFDRQLNYCSTEPISLDLQPSKGPKSCKEWKIKRIFQKCDFVWKNHAKICDRSYKYVCNQAQYICIYMYGCAWELKWVQTAYAAGW